MIKRVVTVAVLSGLIGGLGVGVASPASAGCAEELVVNEYYGVQRTQHDPSGGTTLMRAGAAWFVDCVV